VSVQLKNVTVFEMRFFLILRSGVAKQDVLLLLTPAGTGTIRKQGL